MGPLYLRRKEIRVKSRAHSTLELSVKTLQMEFMNELTNKYKLAMRHMASSVSILSHRKDDQILGMTVTSATSYSAEPPIFMAAIHKESTLAERLSLGDHLAMNLMRAEDIEVARCFSGETGINGADRFQAGDWDMKTNHAPILQTALANFSGHLRALIPQASHAILLVEIDEVITREGEPLIYHNKNYTRSA